jgi:hypothetical protein
VYHLAPRNKKQCPSRSNSPEVGFLLSRQAVHVAPLEAKFSIEGVLHYLGRQNEINGSSDAPLSELLTECDPAWRSITLTRGGYGCDVRVYIGETFDITLSQNLTRSPYPNRALVLCACREAQDRQKSGDKNSYTLECARHDKPPMSLKQA